MLGGWLSRSACSFCASVPMELLRCKNGILAMRAAVDGRRSSFCGLGERATRAAAIFRGTSLGMFGPVNKSQWSKNVVVVNRPSAQTASRVLKKRRHELSALLYVSVIALSLSCLLSRFLRDPRHRQFKLQNAFFTAIQVVCFTKQIDKFWRVPTCIPACLFQFIHHKAFRSTSLPYYRVSSS